MQLGGLGAFSNAQEVIMSEQIKTANPLAERECIPCRGTTAPLTGAPLKELLEKLGGGWQVLEEQRLEKDFRFPDFKSALAFANKVGELAERVNHHPDVTISWGQTKVVIWTHKIGGLSDADFVFAAKVDTL
jgi:4a-hydroxytetrahydrobiopterin dehydratase